jgi:hypothetical protein
MATVRELLAEITSLNALFNGRSDEQVSRLGAVQATSLIAKIGSLRAATTEDAFKLDDAITATDARFDTASLSNALAERLERINAQALKASARSNVSTQLGVRIPRVHEWLSESEHQRLRHKDTTSWRALEIITTRIAQCTGLPSVDGPTAARALALHALAIHEREGQFPRYARLYSDLQTFKVDLSAHASRKLRERWDGDAMPQHPDDVDASWLNARYTEDDPPMGPAADAMWPTIDTVAINHIPLRSTSLLLRTERPAPATHPMSGLHGHRAIKDDACTAIVMHHRAQLPPARGRRLQLEEHADAERPSWARGSFEVQERPRRPSVSASSLRPRTLAGSRQPSVSPRRRCNRSPRRSRSPMRQYRDSAHDPRDVRSARSLSRSTSRTANRDDALHTPCAPHNVGGDGDGEDDGDVSAAKAAPPWRRRDTSAPTVAIVEATTALDRETNAYSAILARDAKRAEDAKERRKVAAAAKAADKAASTNAAPNAAAPHTRKPGKAKSAAIVRANAKARVKNAYPAAPPPAMRAMKAMKVVVTDAKPMKVNLTSMLTKKCVANYEGRREAFGCKARDIAIGMCKSKSSSENIAIATKRHAREIAVAYFDDHFGP